MMSFKILLVYFGLVMGLPAADASQSETNLSTPDVVITFKGFIKFHDYPSLEFTASNCTSHAVWFFGYSSTQPVYDIQHLKGRHWKDDETGWCGVGMERRELRPHNSFTFTVPMDEKPRAMRVGLGCSSHKDYQMKNEKNYWSETLLPRY